MTIQVYLSLFCLFTNYCIIGSSINAFKTYLRCLEFSRINGAREVSIFQQNSIRKSIF